MKLAGGSIVTVIAMIAVAFLTHYLSKESFDLRYTLSEEIPTSLIGGDSTRSLQLLQVGNSGETPLQDVRILIAEPVGRYDIKRFSHSDSFETHSSSNSFELVYKVLPAKASFKLLLESNGPGIEKDHLEVTHLKGVGKEAFREKTDWANLLFISVVLIWGVWMAFLARAAYAEKLSWDARHWATEQMVRRQKPLFISRDKWIDIKSEAIATLVTNERSFGRIPIDSGCYNLN